MVKSEKNTFIILPDSREHLSVLLGFGILSNFYQIDTGINIKDAMEFFSSPQNGAIKRVLKKIMGSPFTSVT